MKRSKPLEVVERVLRNMPITDIEHLYRDTLYGRIYIGFGIEPMTNAYHGIWAFTEGIGCAQTIEFKPHQPKAGVIEELFAQAYLMLDDMAKRHMLKEGYWRVGK